MSHNRIDVVIKIIYSEYFLGITPTNFNKLIYYLHLKKWNNFKASDSYKKKFSDYENEFKKTILSIKKKGFSDKETLIPVDKNNQIIDGSHRLGASIVLNKKISVVKFLVNSPSVTFERFINDFNFKKNIYLVDYLVFNYKKYNKDLRFFTLFPIRNRKFDKNCLKIINQYGEIILTKSFQVKNIVNAFNIFRIFYEGSDWIGNINNKFKGAMWKAETCFGKSNGIIDVVLFNPYKKEYSTVAHLKMMKEQIRKLYEINFHSIHSSDDHDETLRYSKIFFHSNTKLILQNRKGKFFNKLELVLEELLKSKIDPSQFVFSGSAVMGALGLREPKDFDIFHTENFKIPNYISSHNNQIKYFKQKINELIYNPKKYFYYMGFKFLDPKLILGMKINRNKEKQNSKDQNDIKILKNFIDTLSTIQK